MPKGYPKSGTNKGWFKKGSSPPHTGKKRPGFSGENHPRWKGGMPKCICGKLLGNYKAKHCTVHSFDEERKQKIRAGAKKRLAHNHFAWLGKKVSYRGLHAWVVRNFGQPTSCEHCRAEFSGHKIHWANKSRKYYRKRSDWVRLCSKCHGKFDTGHKRKLKV